MAWWGFGKEAGDEGESHLEVWQEVSNGGTPLKASSIAGTVLEVMEVGLQTSGEGGTLLGVCLQAGAIGGSPLEAGEVTQDQQPATGNPSRKLSWQSQSSKKQEVQGKTRS